jgi:hypothetical protein
MESVSRCKLTTYCIAVRLGCITVRTLSISARDIHCWTDSMNCLYRIKSNTSSLNMFVANRVVEIHRLLVSRETHSAWYAIVKWTFTILKWSTSVRSMRSIVKATKDSWHEVVKAVKLSWKLVKNKCIHKLEKARMWQGILLKMTKGQFGSRVRPKSSKRKLEES